MIIADENVERYWIELLRTSGHTVYSIQENHAGTADSEIINIVRERKGILLTEDKDFGELVFAYSIKDISVCFLRYDQPQYQTEENQLLKAI
jgi:predicted nuclease of predicted toxin-antitoxin system